MNNDLISREALKKHITDIFEIEVEIDEKWARGLIYSLKIIDKAPTIERPQGEWENDSDNLPICNKCGEIALQRIFVKMPHLIQDIRMVRSNYCPNCGAKMGGTT